MDARKKILIVDDNRTILKALERKLGAAGYEVVVAKDGHDAVELATTHQPDLVISDVDMPDMDGGQVAEGLQENPATRDIPMIFLTGLVSGEDPCVRGAGGQIYISKSRPDELLKRVSSMLFD